MNREAEFLVRHARVPAELAELVVTGAKQANVSLRELRSPSTAPRLVRAREWVTVKARSLRAPPRPWWPNGGPYSYWEIGRALNRDHSTIWEAERRALASGKLEQ